MKVSDCRQCKFCTRRTWSHYYKPNNYHAIGMSHAYAFCERYGKRAANVKHCETVRNDKEANND